MTKLKKLISPNESSIIIPCPVSNQEIMQRQIDYPILDNVMFAKKYRELQFKEILITMGSVEKKIQANFCTNPYCKWFGMSQHTYRYNNRNIYRYNTEGTFNKKFLTCNDKIFSDSYGPTLNSFAKPLSNWSLAEEIKRLIDNSTLGDLEVKYNFHKENCANSNLTPFGNPKSFHKKGVSSSNSQKYQCIECKKNTNVLPSQRRCYTYNQRRNDILPKFAHQILGRTPVKRTIDILNIGSSTYYNKLEWLFRKCLEFLEKHETKALKNKQFDRLWLNTDKLNYYLNNARKKGHGSDKSYKKERPMFPTAIVATVDSFSRYMFRADLAFDFNVNLEDIEKDIDTYKENKLYNYAQKNARYKYSYYDSTVTGEINENIDDGSVDINVLDIRKHYTNGLHVNSTYTAYAHNYLVKNMINAKKIYYVTDEDASLTTALMRVYSNEIKQGNVNVFTCRVDKKLSREQAYIEYINAKESLESYRDYNKLNISLKETAILKLEDTLSRVKLYDFIEQNGKLYPIRNKGSIEHPYPYKDEGNRYVNFLTDLSHLSNIEIAKLLYKADLRAVNTVFNQIRRKASILERPLVSGRGEGKSYIYSNLNPKYAHYMLTILRTYLNFCQTYKFNKKKVTPAMVLGIAEKPFTIEDIIYFS